MFDSILTSDCFVQEMTNDALRRVVVEYIKAVMQKRITFKNADERKDGAERMIKEAEQFRFLFKKLAAVSFKDATFHLTIFTFSTNMSSSDWKYWMRLK